MDNDKTGVVADEAPAEKPSYGLIDRSVLKQKLDHKFKFQLWNVLPKAHYDPTVNIPGSSWIPVDTLTEALAKQKAKKDEYIVVYCGGGQCVSSKTAAEKLVSWGYTSVFTYEGGLADWKEGGLPLVKI
jgi:rhodanese-related sulfurtransferase